MREFSKLEQPDLLTVISTINSLLEDSIKEANTNAQIYFDQNKHQEKFVLGYLQATINQCNEVLDRYKDVEDNND